MITNVGLVQFHRVLQAAEFYENRGYHWLDVPWAVSAEALAITKPPRLPMEDCPRIPRAGYIVASAEQSFLDIQLEYMLATDQTGRDQGRYVTVTPCFRNELDFDEMHRPYFLKCELIDWKHTKTVDDLHDMIALAHEWFAQYLPVDVVETELNDPIAVSKTYDIVTRRGRIELGSYGVREHNKAGRWLYGTGCAEPRLSYALEKEEQLGGHK